MTLTPGALTRRIAVGSVALVVGAVGVAVAQPAVVAAADLITGKDIKDGTVKKADLAPKVRKQLNAPGPQGPQGPQGAQGLQGTSGTPGVPGAPGSDAPADGPSLVMGRIADPGGVYQCLIGPAIGLSETAVCDNPGIDAVEMPMPRTSVILNFTATRTVTSDEDAFPVFQTNSGDTYCTIAAGTTSCTAPPLLVEGGELVHLEFTEDGAMEGGLLFSYEAWSPSAVAQVVLDTATANAQ